MNTTEIRKRADAATPGPWTNYGDWDTLAYPPLVCPQSSDLAVARCESKNVSAYIHAPLGVITDRRETNEFHNSEFIAHARQDIPYLLDTVDALRGDVTRVTAERDAARKTLDESDNFKAFLDLRAEVTRLRSALEKAEKWILQKREYRDRDHACTECVPGGSIVIPGFQCAFHAALAQARGTP